MTRLILIIISGLVLVGCNGFSNKIKTITELATELTTTQSGDTNIVIDTNLFSVDNLELKQQKHNIFSLTKNNVSASPYVIDNIIYATDSNGAVIAFDIKQRKHLWLRNIFNKTYGTHYLGGGIVSNKNKLYVTNGSRFLVILDKTTGHELLRKEFPDIIRTKPVLLNDNILLIQTVDNQLFAYDVVESSIVWQHEGIFEILSSNLHVSPLIYNDYIIVNYSSGQIFALDAKTGAERWSLNLSHSDDVGLPNLESATLSCKPIIYSKYLYLASNVNKLLKLDITTGVKIWERDAHGVQAMNMLGNSIFITNSAKQIAAVDPNDGLVKWTQYLRKDLQEKTITLNFAPFVTIDNQKQKFLNIATNHETIYSFQFNDNDNGFQITPTLLKTVPGILYIDSINAQQLYFVTNKKILLIE